VFYFLSQYQDAATFFLENGAAMVFLFSAADSEMAIAYSIALKLSVSQGKTLGTVAFDGQFWSVVV